MTLVWPTDVTTLSQNVADLVNSCGSALSTAVVGGDAKNIPVLQAALQNLQSIQGVVAGLSPDGDVVSEGSIP